MVRGIGVRTFFFVDTLAAVGLARLAPEYSIRGSVLLTFLALWTASLTWVLIYNSQIWPKLVSPLRKLPQAPDSGFMTGQWRRIIKEPTGAPMREWLTTVPNKGLIRYTALFNSERIMLTSPEALREVLVTKSYDFVKPELARATLGRLLGFGVLVAEGDEHKFQRKHLMPAFAYRHIKDLVPTFWEKSVEMVSRIAKENANALATTDGAVVKISSWASRCTLDIIGLAGMGFDFKALEDPHTELNETYRRIFSPSQQARMLELLMLFVPLWLVRLIPVSRNSMIAEASQTIRRISRDVIEKKQRKMDAAKEKGLGASAVDKDIISVALESGAFDADNLVDQVMTFLAAGHETTSTATSWAMVALCKYPEVQTRLRDEIREHLPSPFNSSKECKVTAEMIEDLHYLHAFCNEILRFYAPVPLTRRIATEDTTILGQLVPKYTDVMIIPYAINFSKELWGDDADQFRPERWLGKNANSGGATSNFAMLTFLHGPRSCIGQKFSNLEFACIVAAVVGHFDIRLEPEDKEIEIQGGITARPKGGLEVRMKEIPGW